MEDVELVKLYASLGNNAVKHVTDYERSTIKITLSNIRLLQANNYDIDNEELKNNTFEVLNKLRDRKGDLLKPNYKRQIYETLRRIYGDTLNIASGTKFGKRTNERGVFVRNFSQKFRNYLLDILRHFADLLTEFCKDTEKAIKNPSNFDSFDIVAYEVCITSFLSLVSCIHFEGLHKIKMADINRISIGEPIIVDVKRRNKRRFVKNFDLTQQLVTCIMLMRPRVEAILAYRHGLQHSSAARIQKNRIYDKYVLIYGATSLYDGLKKLAADVKFDVSEFSEAERKYFTPAGAVKSLGFNIFRKLMTTTLVEGGHHELAKRMNCHTNNITTLRDYTMTQAKDHMDDLIDNDLAADRAEEARSNYYAQEPLYESTEEPPQQPIRKIISRKRPRPTNTQLSVIPENNPPEEPINSSAEQQAQDVVEYDFPNIDDTVHDFNITNELQQQLIKDSNEQQILSDQFTAKERIRQEMLEKQKYDSLSKPLADRFPFTLYDETTNDTGYLTSEPDFL